MRGATLASTATSVNAAADVVLPGVIGRVGRQPPRPTVAGHADPDPPRRDAREVATALAPGPHEVRERPQARRKAADLRQRPPQFGLGTPEAGVVLGVDRHGEAIVLGARRRQEDEVRDVIDEARHGPCDRTVLAFEASVQVQRDFLGNPGSRGCQPDLEQAGGEVRAVRVELLRCRVALRPREVELGAQAGP